MSESSSVRGRGTILRGRPNLPSSIAPRTPTSGHRRGGLTLSTPPRLGVSNPALSTNLRRPTRPLASISRPNPLSSGSSSNEPIVPVSLLSSVASEFPAPLSSGEHTAVDDSDRIFSYAHNGSAENSSLDPMSATISALSHSASIPVDKTLSSGSPLKSVHRVRTSKLVDGHRSLFENQSSASSAEAVLSYYARRSPVIQFSSTEIEILEAFFLLHGPPSFHVRVKIASILRKSVEEVTSWFRSRYCLEFLRSTSVVTPRNPDPPDMSDWVVFHSLFSQRRRIPAFLWYCHNVGYSPLRREFVSLQVSPDNDFRISSSSPSSSFQSSHGRESFSSTFQNTRLKNSELIHLPRRLRMYFVLDDSYENDILSRLVDYGHSCISFPCLITSRTSASPITIHKICMRADINDICFLSTTPEGEVPVQLCHLLAYKGDDLLSALCISDLVYYCGYLEVQLQDVARAQFSPSQILETLVNMVQSDKSSGSGTRSDVASKDPVEEPSSLLKMEIFEQDRKLSSNNTGPLSSKMQDSQSSALRAVTESLRISSVTQQSMSSSS